MSELEPQVLDARGLSCPMPAMLARQALAKLPAGALTVLLDNDTSAENVARLAERLGWKVQREVQGPGETRLVLSK